MEEKGRIGIPRALMFYRYFPLWQTFFGELGWRVIPSDGLGKRGAILYVEDSCLPMKLLVTHAIQLRDRVDRLFVPRLVSLHRKYLMCPKFRGAPDIVRLATEGKILIVDETIDLQQRGSSLLRSFLNIGASLGVSEKESRQAFLKAQHHYEDFQKSWINRINRLPSRQLFQMDMHPPSSGKGHAFRVAFVGHPYNLFDSDLNKDILALAIRLDMEVVTSDLLSEELIDRHVSDLSKEIYWSSGREIVGSLFHFLGGGVDGVVFLTSFKCGIDALLQEFIKRRLRRRGGTRIPLLILTLDEHSEREGLVTRLEAFRDVMEEMKKAPNPTHQNPNNFQ